MASRITPRFPVTSVTRGADGTFTLDRRADYVAGEEPLEIRLNGTTFTTTMRTPGNDIELAHGLLFAEGVVKSSADIMEARYCSGVDANGRNTYNVLNVDAVVHTPPTPRNVVTTSACGVCGTTAIDTVMERVTSVEPLVLDPEFVLSLPGLLRPHQTAFRRTGGLHAAAAVTLDGEVVVAREDIGRHNAVDKVVGALLAEGALPAERVLEGPAGLSGGSSIDLGLNDSANGSNSVPSDGGAKDKDMVLVVSSRASFELAQKAVLAGFRALVAVSAASSLAVELAQKSGLTLVGFCRDDRFNLYAGEVNA